MVSDAVKLTLCKVHALVKPVYSDKNTNPLVEPLIPTFNIFEYPLLPLWANCIWYVWPEVILNDWYNTWDPDSIPSVFPFISAKWVPWYEGTLL